MDAPISKIISTATARMSESLGWLIQYATDRSEGCESPIESAFSIAFQTQCFLAVLESSPAFCAVDFRFTLEEVVGCEISDSKWFFDVRTQHQIERHRVDFLIQSARKGFAKEDPPILSPKIIVECDGHDFHERTPDQATRDKSRDRQLQSLGYIVFRFTGREIWRDPMACAVQVFELLNKHTDELYDAQVDAEVKRDFESGSLKSAEVA